MIGPLINGAAIVVGSVAGAFVGSKISDNVKQNMPMVFGIASMGLGVAMASKVVALAPVVLALIVGSLFGEIVELENAIHKMSSKTKTMLSRLTPSDGAMAPDEFIGRFVALLVLFSMSATGIYGAMVEGMTGDTTLLIVKAILDLFTAMIFAATMGYIIAVLAIPQLVIQGLFFFAAVLIIPLTTPAMLADFSACGGCIMLAVGMRICGIKQFPVANMIPALWIVMPISWGWSVLFA
ncbi:DUF554 domain-containing protein [Cohaesibacter haloalkalitolerans]|jgi:uncharacterized membrane protein YqgA involved in biofilm formation|uniref:DUF554 domain-containing protein n=1 Tax=Cohaesibacter haloalkalitolerans TaxID=1162980 RepID=UPI000E653D40|nr:DUF554 domain-containing protein [Cohaesibacter haloalkalitolerans]